MGSFILAAILPEILSLLQGFVKNPQSIAKEKAILTEISTLIGQILGQI